MIPLVKETGKEYTGGNLKDSLGENDRPREVMMKKGPEALSEAELMAVIIGSGAQGENVVDLCQRIINDHDGKLCNLARTTRKALERYHGVGEVKALQIQAALELARRYQREEFTDNRKQVTTPQLAYEAVRALLSDKDHEEFWMVMLDTAKHVIGSEMVGMGSLNATIVDVKKIMKIALDHSAHSIIVAHNHPSDNSNPSRQDDQLTSKIKQACNFMDIYLLDHIIVCRGGNYFSYVANGRLD